MTSGAVDAYEIFLLVVLVGDVGEEGGSDELEDVTDV